jgi:cytosine/uracil/thiamine/allantoin permease
MIPTSLFRLLAGPFGIPLIGLAYIMGKIIVRHLVHAAIDHVYDFWSTLAWFGVDATLLSLSVSVACQVPNKLRFDPQQAHAWYFCFVFSALISLFLYLFFTKRRDRLQQVRPYEDFLLSCYVTGLWLSGFLWFWKVLNTLKT